MGEYIFIRVWLIECVQNLIEEVLITHFFVRLTFFRILLFSQFCCNKHFIWDVLPEMSQYAAQWMNQLMVYQTLENQCIQPCFFHVFGLNIVKAMQRNILSSQHQEYIHMVKDTFGQDIFSDI